MYHTDTNVPREFIGGYCSCARSDIDVVPLQYRITIVVIVIGYFASQLLVLVGDSDEVVLRTISTRYRCGIALISV